MKRKYLLFIEHKKTIMVFDLKELSAAKKQYLLQSIIAPRPICFASTIDKEGRVNLSPFSFFNMFSANPPIVIFSPARRVRDNTTKHTLQNVLEVPEVVINIVTYDMVQQMSLSSCEYGKDVDEFTKAGFTKEKADIVSPPMVKESKAKLECKVIEVKSLGNEGGAGNLVICEILRLHLNDRLMMEDDKLDPSKLELVARLGGDWYCRISNENLFMVPKPNIKLGIGIDALPEHIRFSKYLTGNHLGMLANVEELPMPDDEFSADVFENMDDSLDKTEQLHQHAILLLNQNKVHDAWQVLLKK